MKEKEVEKDDERGRLGKKETQDSKLKKTRIGIPGLG
jgi:hypothetical protein